MIRSTERRWYSKPETYQLAQEGGPPFLANKHSSYDRLHGFYKPRPEWGMSKVSGLAVREVVQGYPRGPKQIGVKTYGLENAATFTAVGVALGNWRLQCWQR